MTINKADAVVATNKETKACFGNGLRRPRLLVPVDCTEFCDAVLDLAACTAGLLNAEVHLLAVVEPEHDRGTLRPVPTWYPSYTSDAWGSPDGPDPIVVESRDQVLEATRQEAWDYLRQTTERFDGLPVTTRVLLSKSVGRTVVDYARDCEVDLIAMATHGRTPIAQALLGSVAAEVVHSGVAPCLLVKPSEA